MFLRGRGCALVTGKAQVIRVLQPQCHSLPYETPIKISIILPNSNEWQQNYFNVCCFGALVEDDDGILMQVTCLTLFILSYSTPSLMQIRQKEIFWESQNYNKIPHNLNPRVHSILWYKDKMRTFHKRNK